MNTLSIFNFQNHEGRNVLVSVDGPNPKVVIEKRNTNDRAERGYRLDMALELIMEDAIAEALAISALCGESQLGKNHSIPKAV